VAAFRSGALLTLLGALPAVRRALFVNPAAGGELLRGGGLFHGGFLFLAAGFFSAAFFFLYRRLFFRDRFLARPLAFFLLFIFGSPQGDDSFHLVVDHGKTFIETHAGFASILSGLAAMAA
jgi:hypothetical protein